jgi:hypothetical protein
MQVDAKVLCTFAWRPDVRQRIVKTYVGRGPQRVHASKNNAVHSQQHILTQL